MRLDGESLLKNPGFDFDQSGAYNATVLGESRASLAGVSYREGRVRSRYFPSELTVTVRAT